MRGMVRLKSPGYVDLTLDAMAPGAQAGTVRLKSPGSVDLTLDAMASGAQAGTVRLAGPIVEQLEFAKADEMKASMGS